MMAFIQAVPLPTTSARGHLALPSSSPQRRSSSTTTIITTVTRTPRASANNAPTPPPDFSEPNPRPFYVRPDKLGDVATMSVGGLLRLGSGAFIEGYRLRRPSTTSTTSTSTTTGKKQRVVEEYSATLPATRPAKPLHLFEFESCPFCRRVREAVNILDLDVIIFPCPKGSVVYRPYVTATGGKAQFPYLDDPNTGYAAYESDDIISYLYKTYGPASPSVPLSLSSATTVSAGLASLARFGKGGKRATAAVPAKKIIEFWGYEASPFSKVVREVLNELEIAHWWHPTTRGSPNRKTLKDMTGRFQVPYVVDRNTGIEMFESAEIADYLRATYGPDAAGAVESPTEDDVYMPGQELVEVPTQPSLDPQPIKDETLEEYCGDNPDADECRVYED